MIGPETEFSQKLHQVKYRPGTNETFDDYCVRWSRTLKDSEQHFYQLLRGTRDLRILPAGRQQLAVGRGYQTTAYNCFVMGRIPDDTAGIFEALKESAMTLRAGGGIGMDFSTIRPRDEPVRGLGAGAKASGPVSFMRTWDTMSGTICSAGERRGAMMFVLRCDHPDIMEFIRAKRPDDKGIIHLQHANMSVAVTDEFMDAVRRDLTYDLKFNGTVIRRGMRALDVWAAMMENNWDHGEPGVIFIDRVNRMSPLGYCEQISASNPCGEQMLPPYGACLLLAQNMVKYLMPSSRGGSWEFDEELWVADARASVRAMDRVIDVSSYPLAQQQEAALGVRRIGLGVTGVANALEVMGFRYGSERFCEKLRHLLILQRDGAVRESVQLAVERGPFPLFNAEGWLGSGWAQTLPEELRDLVRTHGIRNGQLLSIAPTGTISWVADSASSSIEPVFSHRGLRKVKLPDVGDYVAETEDYALMKFGVRCTLARDVLPEEHVRVLATAQSVVDNAVSKTINYRGHRGGGQPGPGELTYEQMKDVYLMADDLGCKGCTTFNENGALQGILAHREEAPSNDGPRLEDAQLVGETCVLDPVTGRRDCG